MQFFLLTLVPFVLLKLALSFSWLWAAGITAMWYAFAKICISVMWLFSEEGHATLEMIEGVVVILIIMVLGYLVIPLFR